MLLHLTVGLKKCWLPVDGEIFWPRCPLSISGNKIIVGRSLNPPSVCETIGLFKLESQTTLSVVEPHRAIKRCTSNKKKKKMARRLRHERHAGEKDNSTGENAAALQATSCDCKFLIGFFLGFFQSNQVQQLSSGSCREDSAELQGSLLHSRITIIPF